MAMISANHTHMKFSSSHFNATGKIAGILWKYVRSDLVQQMGKHDGIDPAEFSLRAIARARRIN